MEPKDPQDEPQEPLEREKAIGEEGPFETTTNEEEADDSAEDTEFEETNEAEE